MFVEDEVESAICSSPLSAQEMLREVLLNSPPGAPGRLLEAYHEARLTRGVYTKQDAQGRRLRCVVNAIDPSIQSRAGLLRNLNPRTGKPRWDPETLMNARMLIRLYDRGELTDDMVGRAARDVLNLRKEQAKITNGRRLVEAEA